MRERYLVASREEGELLSRLATQFRGDSEIDLVDAIGPTGRPDTLVLSMTPDRARKLKNDFAGKLIVEKDSTLTA